MYPKSMLTVPHRVEEVESSSSSEENDIEFEAYNFDIEDLSRFFSESAAWL